MRKFLIFVMAVLIVCCQKRATQFHGVQENCGVGGISVSLRYAESKAGVRADCLEILDEECDIKRIDVLVFEKSTGRLSASLELASLEDECNFVLPAGEKIIFAIVNCPHLDSLTTVGELMCVIDDLSETEIGADGFVMFGQDECVVVDDDVVPSFISVERLVSRIVLRSVRCSVPRQYDKMTIDCVFLGNAHTRQTFGGEISEMVNSYGYADASKKKPIGLSGVQGTCPEYLYRDLGESIGFGETMTRKTYLYCQPNTSEKYTCMYILATIGSGKYYYRVGFPDGIEANTTYSVDVNIVNLGAPTPPDDDIGKGEIVAEIYVEGWYPGENYLVEF